MTIIGSIKITIPNTKARFAMFEPITLPMAKSGWPIKADFTLTISSGADVANETTVIPITILGMERLIDKATAAFKSQSPPLTRISNPKKIAI